MQDSIPVMLNPDPWNGKFIILLPKDGNENDIRGWLGKIQKIMENQND